ncbi:MAG: phosphoribosylanthranilate isomerase [Firmicutes bacterium]|nr:phosphoribosylanthranilate isomerase [Bacillota bacterium]
MIIKICGMQRPEDIDYVNEFHPDLAGFIFAEGRRRRITPGEAARLRRRLAPDIRAVGVFVNEDVRRLPGAAELAGMDMIQLHGSESEAYIRELKEMTPLPVIKAFRIETEADIARAAASPADYILLDSGQGGTGRAFDWQLAASARRDYFLAGGLTPDNVAAAVAALRPAGVDVSSGVETAGRKDRDKIRRFIQEARAAAEGPADPALH